MLPEGLGYLGRGPLNSLLEGSFPVKEGGGRAFQTEGLANTGMSF